jgi:integrase
MGRSREISLPTCARSRSTRTRKPARTFSNSSAWPDLASGSRIAHARRRGLRGAANHHLPAQDRNWFRRCALSSGAPAVGTPDEGKANDERVFRIADAKKALASACRRLGFSPFSQRSLRRLFITRAIEKGVDVKVIAEWQGHKDGGKLILDTYSHVNRAHSQRMAQLMNEPEPENVVVMKQTKAA